MISSLALEVDNCNSSDIVEFPVVDESASALEFQLFTPSPPVAPALSASVSSDSFAKDISVAMILE